MTLLYGSQAWNWVNSVSGFEVLDAPVAMGQSEPNYDKGKGVKSGFFHPKKLTDTFQKGNEVKLILEIVW